MFAETSSCECGGWDAEVNIAGLDIGMVLINQDVYIELSRKYTMLVNPRSKYSK